MNLGDESGSSSASSSMSEYVSSSAGLISCDLVSIMSVAGVRPTPEYDSLQSACTYGRLRRFGSRGSQAELAQLVLGLLREGVELRP
jgi:hypothetical protein